MKMTQTLMDDNRKFMTVWAIMMAYMPAFVGAALAFGK